MNRILLIALTGFAFAYPEPLMAAGTLASDHQIHYRNHDKRRAEKAVAIVKEYEEHLERIKTAGTSLPADLKVEFDYNLAIAEAEIKTLKEVNLKKHKKHIVSCHHHLASAEKIVKTYERQIARERRMEARKVKMEEHKQRIAQRKSRREEEKSAHHKIKDDGLDHGKFETTDNAMSAKAIKHIGEDKK